MAISCKQQQEKIEETVLQPIDTWVNQQQQRCQDQPCDWWTLCLNKLFCWLVWVLVKVTEWVLTVVVRYVYRLVCVVVSLVVGLVALLWGDTSILVQAVGDLWDLVKDVVYTAVGLAIFVVLRIVDIVQSIFGLQPRKRRLTERERSFLYPIFRDSLNYGAIEIVPGKAGLLGISGRSFTMGFTIYLAAPADDTLVHECVHVWQFEFTGFRYIGNSALNQLDSSVFNKGYDPYSWTGKIDGGATWYTLGSAEAQAQLIQDVFNDGEFVLNDPAVPPDAAPGAFFREDAKAGMNRFVKGRTNYTKVANDAWRIIRTA
jgi:hypothetical protein